MPRPSLNPDRARSGGGGGIESGNYEVLAAKFANIKTDFKSNQLYQVFELATLDKDGDKVRGADPVELRLPFGEKAHEAFTPGVAKSIDDDDAEDQGLDPDKEGNTIYCRGAEQFSGSSGAMIFQKSLVAQGFPKDVLDKCWAPSFVGLKFSLATLTPKEANEKYKVGANEKPFKNAAGELVAYTVKVATAWLNPNYMSAASKNGSSPHVSTTEAMTAEEIAVACLAKVSKQKAGPKNSIKTYDSLKGFATNAFATGKFKGSLVDVRKFFEDKAWVMDQLLGLEAELDMSDDGEWTGKVTFPALA